MASTLITGASKGIGMATALVLARAGHTVYATMRSPSRSPELSEIATREKLPIQVLPMDVDSDESVKKTVESILTQNRSIDVLVNNAGIESRGSVEELDLSIFRQVMETNYFGPIRTIQAVLPQMRARKSGLIVNIASIAGRLSCSPFAPYSASKYALEALSEALAQEVKSFNVRVAIVEPGIIDTSMARGISKTRPSIYPQSRRITGLFMASLENPVTPTLVGEKIREIIESDTWTLRHPVGPDASPFLQWRNSMTDEQWVDWGAADDDSWYASIKRDFGLDARSKVPGS
jgi:NAD(P)-dependent dehydrogenase (short-subunit alcohol dehydrogenase family)